MLLMFTAVIFFHDMVSATTLSVPDLSGRYSGTWSGFELRDECFTVAQRDGQIEVIFDGTSAFHEPLEEDTLYEDRSFSVDATYNVVENTLDFTTEMNTCNCDCDGYSDAHNQDSVFCKGKRDETTIDEPYCYDGGDDKLFCSHNEESKYGDTAGPCCNLFGTAVKFSGIVQTRHRLRFDIEDGKGERFLGGSTEWKSETGIRVDVGTETIESHAHCVTSVDFEATDIIFMPMGTCKIIEFEAPGGDEQAVMVSLESLKHPFAHGYSGINYVAIMSPGWGADRLHNDPLTMDECDPYFEDSKCWASADDIGHQGFASETCEATNHHGWRADGDPRAADTEPPKVVADGHDPDVQASVRDNSRIVLWYLGGNFVDHCGTQNGTYYVYIRTDDKCWEPEACAHGVYFTLTTEMEGDLTATACWWAENAGVAIVLFCCCPCICCAVGGVCVCACGLSGAAASSSNQRRVHAQSRVQVEMATPAHSGVRPNPTPHNSVPVAARATPVAAHAMGTVMTPRAQVAMPNQPVMATATPVRDGETTYFGASATRGASQNQRPWAMSESPAPVFASAIPVGEAPGTHAGMPVQAQAIPVQAVPVQAVPVQAVPVQAFPVQPNIIY